MRRVLSGLILVLILTSCATPAKAQDTIDGCAWGCDRRWVGPVAEHPHPGDFGEVIA